MLEEVTAISETRVGKRGFGGHYGWLEGELVLQKDLEVEFLHLLFHLFGDCFVCLVGHRRFVYLQLSRLLQ